DVPGRVAGDGRDVVDAVELHARRLPDARRAPGGIEDPGEPADPSPPPARGGNGDEPGQMALAPEQEAAGKRDSRAVRRPGRMLVVGLARRQPPETGAVGADDVDLAVGRARPRRACRAVVIGE